MNLFSEPGPGLLGKRKMKESGAHPNLKSCFICHSQFQEASNPECSRSDSELAKIAKITEIEPRKSSSTEPTDFTIQHALTYIFELNQAQIQQLTELNINAMSLCVTCSELLTTAYTSRRELVNLTSRNSCVYSILGKSDDSNFDGKNAVNISEISDPDVSEDSLNDLKSNNSTMTVPENENNDLPIIPDPELDIEILLTPSPPTIEPLSVIIDTDIVIIGQVQVNLAAKSTPRIQKFPRISNPTKSATDKILNPGGPRTRIQPFDAKKLTSNSNSSLIILDLKKFPCERCDKQFHCARDIGDHLRTCFVHNESTNYVVCPVCSHPNIGRKYLKSHLRSHMSEEEIALEYTCCGQKFETRGQLQTHHSQEHRSPKPKKRRIQKPKPDAKKISTCPECGKVFNTVDPYKLKRHLNVYHRNIIKYQCDICGKPFEKERCIQQHKLTHLNPEERKALTGVREKPYLCAECGLTVYTKSSLQTHIIGVHEKSKPKPTYPCDKCDVVILTKKTFEQHVRDHEISESNQYYYSCPHCPTKFKFKRELRRHPVECLGQTHERPHLCVEESCIRRFKYKQHLELHLSGFHKYSIEEAREIVYPGIPAPEVAFHKRRRGPTKRKRKTS